MWISYGRHTHLYHGLTTLKRWDHVRSLILEPFVTWMVVVGVVVSYETRYMKEVVVSGSHGPTGYLIL